MEKLQMQTASLADKNFAALQELFPEVVTETVDENGAAIRAVDAEKLAQAINSRVVSEREERYQFTWPEKRQAMLLANTPSDNALRPCREESVNFDTTENLYIEGDNLEVLKLLRETYLNRVKMIYIDPPYNTGNDFVYRDSWSVESDQWRRISGDFAEDGNRMVKNLDSNGRFHTDWLNMIYPRLKLARDLLSEDGVIFISIDDNEVHNLRKICDEIFGEGNFVAQLIWERAYAPKNDAKYISNSHDYVFMYAKNITQFVIGRLPRTEEANARYRNPDQDPRGVWKPGDMSVKTYNVQYDYPITLPSGKIVEPPTGRCWRFSKEAYEKAEVDNRIWFGINEESIPQVKRFLSELKFSGMAPQSILFYKDVGHSQEGAKEVTALLEAGAFDGPKPVRLLNRLLILANLENDSLILDFFSGSSTTAHAVMQQNAEDGGQRKFIMVQLPELTDEKSEAHKAGYRNICEIGKERIRRAGKMIAAEKEKKAKEGSDLFSTEDDTAELDIGFRVLKLDSSNMKDVFYTPAELTTYTLDGLSDNIKSDRTSEDLLFQVLLELGVPLSAKIERRDNTFYVDGNYLIACFARVDDKRLTEIARAQPYYAVFRDGSFASDSAMTNCEQIFKTYSPTTIRKVL